MAWQGIFAWRSSLKWVEKAWLGTWYSVTSNYTTIVTVHHRNFSFWPEAKCILKQTSFESFVCFEMILKSTLQIRFGTSQIFFFKGCFAFRQHFFACQLIWLLQLLQVILPLKSSSCFLSLHHCGHTVQWNVLPRGGQIYSRVRAHNWGREVKWKTFKHTEKRITFSTLRRLENHL